MGSYETTKREGYLIDYDGVARLNNLREGENTPRMIPLIQKQSQLLILCYITEVHITTLSQ